MPWSLARLPVGQVPGGVEAPARIHESTRGVGGAKRAAGPILSAYRLPDPYNGGMSGQDQVLCVWRRSSERNKINELLRHSVIHDEGVGGAARIGVPPMIGA